MRIVIDWLVTAVALAITAWIVPGIMVPGGVLPLLFAALVIGLVNAFVRPVAVILTLPITIVTLGLFYLVLNGLLFYLAAAVTPGFELAGFWSAVLGAILMSVAGTVLHALVPGD